MLLNIEGYTQDVTNIPVIFPVLISFELLVWLPATSLYVVKSALALAPLWLNGIVGKFVRRVNMNRFKRVVEESGPSILFILESSNFK